ncbi:RNA pseudouridine synthase [Candidatus Vidania fulgoroideae]|uniref:RNA pseudouridine synthase n=1 Tax=Candidatus Vidania fulgoroideorum TaxID=881286 RepID=A0A975ADW0_9PROT|nr:RNA pseudouridine synthase [Candidatus Vidania fulgoroideae]
MFNDIIAAFKQQYTNSDSIASLYPNYYLFNRLDYDVSGLLLYVSKHVLNIFCFRKLYYAVIYGFFYNCFSIHSICNYKYSLSRIYLVSYLHNLNISIVKIEIITGRKNQIRKQLSLLGYPIVLDSRFGNRLLDNFLKFKTPYEGIQLFPFNLSIMYGNNCIPSLILKWLYQKKGKQYQRKINC